MYATVTLEEAQAKLPELIAQVADGEEIVIMQGQKPVARLIAQPPEKRKPRKAGSAKGKLIVVQEDDEHLKDFEEYLQ